MASKETPGMEKSFLPALNLTEMTEMGKKNIEEFVNVQTELLNKLQEANRQWFDRAKSEADLASELASKLSAARSIPEAMAACQKWSTRRFEMMAEDGKHLMEDGQKLFEIGARLFSDGWGKGEAKAGSRSSSA